MSRATAAAVGVLAVLLLVRCRGDSESEQLRARVAELEVQSEMATPLGTRARTCGAAAAWRASAQEWLFTSNEFVRPAELYLDSLRRAWVPLGNVALPLEADDPESRLLVLMRRWRSEVERWMSALPRDVAQAEDARLAMNATIEDANALLTTECGLESMLLYQPRPRLASTTTPAATATTTARPPSPKAIEATPPLPPLPIPTPSLPPVAPTPRTVPVVPGGAGGRPPSFEAVLVVKSIEYDHALVQRINGELWLLNYGVGCLSLPSKEGREVYISSPGLLFAGIGSRLFIPDREQSCRIWSSEPVG